jgi:hypothetical protein
MNKMVYFSFLKQNVKQIVPNITSIQQLIGLNNLRPTIYFSISLKEQLKYIFGKNKLLYNLIVINILKQRLNYFFIERS